MRLSAHVAIALLFAAAVALAEPAAAADGKQLLAKNCQTCHSVSTAGIEATTKSEKMKGPDLAGVVQAHEPAWIVDFVKKKVDKDGKKHSKEFKGTDAELTAIIEWLKTQTKS